MLGQKDKILEAYESNLIGPDRKKIKLPNYPDVDKAVLDWFDEMKRYNNVIISGIEIQLKAIKFATMLGHTDFKASPAWLSNLKDRNNLSLKISNGEAGLVDKEIVENWVENVLPDLIQDYDIKDINNADETALFYRALPERTMYYKQIKCDSNKVSKERITLLLCCNMDGSDKLKPLMISNSENPRCFKDISKNN